MNWEGFRTLLLTVLVLLSFVLTWNLWTNQTGANKSEGSNFVNSDIVKNGKKTISQVVHPDKAVYFDNKKYYGLVNGNNLEELFQTISSAKFDVFYTRAGSSLDLKSNMKEQETPNPNRVELLFPTRIPLMLFGSILSDNSNGKTNNEKVFMNADSSLLFNHIVFNQHDSSGTTNMVAYFMNGTTITAKAKVSNVSFTDLKSIFQNHKQPFLAEQVPGTSKVFYLPADPKPKVVYYQYEMIGAGKFKNAFFPNPNANVAHQSDYYFTEATFLRTSHDMLKYINSAPGTERSKTNQTTQTQTAIETGLEIINSHSGWTDNYMLFQYTQPKGIKSSSQAVTVYRLLVGGGELYPVFSSIADPFTSFDAGTIRVAIQNGDIAGLSRTIMNLTQQTYSEVSQFEMGKDTGEDVWKQLTSSKDVEMKLVKDIRIGYEMTFPPVKSRTITFTPKWYVLYNGNWQTVDHLTGKGKKEQKGRAS